MAAAFLDVELKAMLEFFFVENKSIHKRFFGFGGPCGPFSSRIDTAYLLGLISKSGHQDLTIIRKIRNDFAHVHEPITFDSQKIRNRCRAMSWCGDEVDGKPRNKYIRSVMAVTSSIHTAYLLKPIFSEREHLALKSDDESELMLIRDHLLDDILSGKLSYDDMPAMVRRIAADIDRHQDGTSDD